MLKLYVILIASLTVLPVGAQIPFTLDYSYGSNGIATDAVPTHWLLESRTSFHVYDDGEAMFSRIGPIDDTAGYVSRFLVNGQPDLFYGLGGSTPIGLATNSMKSVAFIDDIAIIGGSRYGRYETVPLTERGKIDLHYGWQDEEKSGSMVFLGAQPNGTLVFWNSPSSQSGYSFRLRYLSVAPFKDRGVVNDTIDTTPMAFGLRTEGILNADHLVDAQGRVLLTGFTNTGVAVMRIKANGERDVDFGNQIGISVIQTPPGLDRASPIAYIKQLRGGGYAVVTTLQKSDGSENPGIYVYKLTEDGMVNTGFGTNGYVVLSGYAKMEYRGLTELPNGDLIVLSFGTWTYSHAYHVSSTGVILPGSAGEVSITSLMSDGVVVANKWLYGLAWYGETGNMNFSNKLARFNLDRSVTSVDVERSVDNVGQCSASVYSVTGELIHAGEYSSAEQVKLTQGLPHGPLFVVIRTPDGEVYRTTMMVQ